MILSVCKTVPDGVLVFLPSYSLLDRLMRQWQVSTFNTICQSSSYKCFRLQPNNEHKTCRLVFLDHSTGAVPKAERNVVARCEYVRGASWPISLSDPVSFEIPFSKD